MIKTRLQCLGRQGVPVDDDVAGIALEPGARIYRWSEHHKLTSSCVVHVQKHFGNEGVLEVQPNYCEEKAAAQELEAARAEALAKERAAARAADVVRRQRLQRAQCMDQAQKQERRRRELAAFNARVKAGNARPHSATAGADAQPHDDCSPRIDLTLAVPEVEEPQAPGLRLHSPYVSTRPQQPQPPEPPAQPQGPLEHEAEGASTSEGECEGSPAEPLCTARQRLLGHCSRPVAAQAAWAGPAGGLASPVGGAGAAGVAGPVLARVFREVPLFMQPKGPAAPAAPQHEYRGQQGPSYITLTDRHAPHLRRAEAKMLALGRTVPPLCSCASGASPFSVAYVTRCARNCPLYGRRDLHEALLNSVLRMEGVI